MTVINNHDLERMAKAFLEICNKEITDLQKTNLIALKLWNNLEMEETSNYTDTCVYVYTSKDNIKRHRDIDDLEIKYYDKRAQLIKLKQTLTECMDDIHMANNLR